MKSSYPNHSSVRWHAIKLLENDEEVKKDHPLEVEAIADHSYEKEITAKKYEYIEKIIEEVLFYRDRKAASTDRIDKVLTHPIWGVPVFLCIMALVFFLTFFVGDFLKGGLEYALAVFSDLMRAGLEGLHVAGWMVSLVVDGVIAGVGGILTFVPNIFILFLALAVLEDSGYMARVAYVMDGIMGKVGLSFLWFLASAVRFRLSWPQGPWKRSMTEEER